MDYFRLAKYSRLDRSQAPFSTGFITWGLFSLSRHPNYLAEQTIWLVFYLFSARMNILQ